jgi:saposin
MFKVLISILFLSNIALIQGQSQGCQICESVIGEAQNLLQQNATDASIFNFLKTNICGLVGGQLQQQCKSLIDMEGPAIITALVNELNPQTVCKQLGLCKQFVNSKRSISAPKPAANCFTCKLLVGQVEQLVLNNQTETQIITALETKICPALGTLAPACKQLVEQYGPIIIQNILNGASPEKICELIGQCPKPPRKATVQTAPKQAANCFTCKLLVGQVENLVANNQTEAQIINTLETKLCPALGTLAPACKQLVEQFGPMIIQYILNGASPEKICELIGQCPKPPRKAPKPAANCFTCKLLVGQVEQLVLNNQTESQIINTLETKLCPALGSLANTCKQLVEQFGPNIIEQLLNGASPEKVCELIGQCPKPPRKAVVHAAKPKAQNCVACKLLVSQVESYVLNNQTESQIINTLETKLCPALGSLASTCKQLVEQYGPNIIEQLLNGIAPEKVCELIGQCPKPPRESVKQKTLMNGGAPVVQRPIFQTKDIQPPLDADEEY